MKLWPVGYGCGMRLCRRWSDPQSTANYFAQQFQFLESAVPPGRVALLQFVSISFRALKPKETDFEPQTSGEHIRKRRLELRLTQKHAAEQLGVNPWTVPNYVASDNYLDGSPSRCSCASTRKPCRATQRCRSTSSTAISPSRLTSRPTSIPSAPSVGWR